MFRLFSVLLESFARSLYQTNRSYDLLSIFAYKESDEAAVQVIYKLAYIYKDAPELIQILVELNSPVNFVNRNVDGYELQMLEIGSDFDLKEEVFRKYHGVFSEVFFLICLLIIVIVTRIARTLSVELSLLLR